MTEVEFENAFDAGYFDGDYMEFIQENADPSVRPIYNGDSLLDAFESMYLFDEFRNHILNRG